jgi:hypothetical protein
MAETRENDWYKNWLERLAQLQTDGSYIVRPFGRRAIVYQVDRSTKEQLFKFHVAYRRSMYIALVLVVYAQVQLRPTDRWYLIPAIAGILYAFAYYGLTFAILSRGQKVPLK